MIALIAIRALRHTPNKTMNALSPLIKIVGLAWSLCALDASAQAPLEIGSRKQLFIDKRFIAAGAGVELHTNPAQKLGLILDEKGQPSSESGHTSRVIEDQGRI